MIDPGGPEAVDIAKRMMDRGTPIKHILITHGHFDHIGWAGEVKKISGDGCKIYASKFEKEPLPDFNQWPQRFGFPSKTISMPDEWIEPDIILNLEGIRIEAIHAPGHTPGSTVYYVEDSNLAFTGDVLFQLSIGRTDFPFSDPETMDKSLKKLVEKLPNNTDFWPGHGDASTIAFEKINNPFLIALQKKN